MSQIIEQVQRMPLLSRKPRISTASRFGLTRAPLGLLQRFRECLVHDVFLRKSAQLFPELYRQRDGNFEIILREFDRPLARPPSFGAALGMVYVFQFGTTHCAKPAPARE